jgi:hypothetical protein
LFAPLATVTLLVAGSTLTERISLTSMMSPSELENPP